MSSNESLPRITIVTNGNTFARMGLLPLLEGAGRDWELQVIVTSGLRRQKGNRAVEALRLFRRWGLRYSAYKVSTYVLPQLSEWIRRKPRRVQSECEARGIPVALHRNVNRGVAFESIERFGPDLLLSFSCPYRILTPLLELPRVGCMNVHSSLLPAFAGVCTYVHVLAQGCERTGVTVHEMVEKFDAGQILAQAEIAIETRTTVFRLFSEQCLLAGALLRESVESALARRALEGRPQDSDRRSYCGEPQRGDIRALHARGHALMDRRDIARILGSSRKAKLAGHAARA